MMSTEQEPTVRDIATVTPITPVDGTKKRKPRSDKGKRRTPKVRHHLTLDDCLPEIAAAARAARLPGQVIRVVSPTEVLVENK